MKRITFKVLAVLVVVMTLLSFSQSAKAHNVNNRTYLYWSLGFGFYPYYSTYRGVPYSFFFPSFYSRPPIYYTPAAAARDYKFTERIINTGELKKENWINARNNPPQFIPTPVLPEKLESPEIKTEKRKEL